MSEQSFNIRFDGVELIEKHLFKGIASEHDKFTFDTKVQTLIDPIKNILVAFVSVGIRKEDGSETFATIICAFGYHIAELSSLKDEIDQNKYNIPPELDNMVKQISISTMRGIIFSEFRGTHLHRAILPIIFVDTLVAVDGNVIDLPIMQ